VKKQYQRSVVVLGILFCGVGIAAPSFGGDSSAPLGSCTTISGELNCVTLNDLPAAPEVQQKELDAFDLPSSPPVQENKAANPAHAKEKAEKERAAAQAKADRERIAKEQAEQAKSEKERAAAQAKADRERIAKEQAEQAKSEKERAAAQAKADRERIAKEQAEQERIARSTWTMRTGHTVGQELQAWGVRAGWKIIWNMPKDWAVPAQSTFYGDFQKVASDVIITLASNGALVRAQFFEGNKTVVVTGPGVAAQ